jgi:hypothetical protein
MNRHVRQYCKIANTEEGMEKLVEHTLQRQLAEQSKEMAEMRVQVLAQSAQVAELAALLRSQLVAPVAAPPTVVQVRNEAPSIVNTGPITNTTQHIIALVPWDGGRRLEVGIAQIAAAFAENGRLKEYASLPAEELTDPEIAPPYVTELFMDLTKRAHADPAARNVYLNPRRADQALVHLSTGRWEVVALGEATRLLLDGVAGSIHKVAGTWAELKQLPQEAQNALSLAGMVYEEEPEEYVKRAKAPMSAHLTNMAPGPVGPVGLLGQ